MNLGCAEVAPPDDSNGKERAARKPHPAPGWCAETSSDYIRSRWAGGPTSELGMEDMASQSAVRFDDLLLDAVAAIRGISTRGKGWDGATDAEKGRAVELGRGVAGERRYAKQTGDEVLLARVEALRLSAEARLRMLEGRTTPGDEEVAARFEADADAYGEHARAEVGRGSAPPDP